MNLTYKLLRALYTGALVIASLIVIMFFVANWAASVNGHGNFELFSLFNLVILALYLLLLISRVMSDNNPKWLWLGAPTALAVLGGFSALAISVIFLN